MIAEEVFVTRLNSSKIYSTISISWRSKGNQQRHTGRSFILIKEDMLGPQEWEASQIAALHRSHILELHLTGLRPVLDRSRLMHHTPPVANLETFKLKQPQVYGATREEPITRAQM